MLLCPLLCDKMHYHPEKLLFSNQFSIDGMRKLFRISMYTCELIVPVMIAISLVL